VKVAIGELQARKAEAARSTRHGHTFEEQVFSFAQQDALRSGDVAQFTGNTPGLIKGKKVGDVVVELGPESAAPQACIVLEAKESTGYDLKAMLEELDEARKNRGAQIGIFVCSCRTAPAGSEPLLRRGSNIVVHWNADDAGFDVFFRAALTLARALCVREQQRGAAEAADLADIDKAILEIEKRTGDLDDICTWANTIANNAEKILAKQERLRKALDSQIEVLRSKTETLKALTQDERH
jgi:hypothetical protein